MTQIVIVIEKKYWMTQIVDIMIIMPFNVLRQVQPIIRSLE